MCQLCNEEFNSEYHLNIHVLSCPNNIFCNKNKSFKSLKSNPYPLPVLPNLEEPRTINKVKNEENANNKNGNNEEISTKVTGISVENLELIFSSAETLKQQIKKHNDNMTESIRICNNLTKALKPLQQKLLKLKKEEEEPVNPIDFLETEIMEDQNS